MQLQQRHIILIAAAVIAGVMAVMVKNRLTAKPKAAVEMTDSKRILVAKRDVQAGKFVDSGLDLEWVEMKADDADVIREGKIKKSEFNGGIARKPLKAGKPIAPDEITKAGDGGFLSAVLEPGMRAVAIAVTATTGAAGFIAPGDRVDLIVTHRVKAGRGESGGDAVMSETFVRDVRVVAVDQSLGTPENKAQLAKNVTVEVNEKQAEQIAIAGEMGKISMALRSSLQKDGDMKAVQVDDDSRLGRSGVAPRVQLIRGAEKEDLQFSGQGAR